MVIVINPILVERRRPGRLDAPDETFLNQHSQGVVDRLPGDGPYLSANIIGNVVSRAVRPLRDRPQDGQSLGGHLDPMLA